MSIELIISVGEAIDKLTILDIKKRFISDERKLKHVNLEWTMLNTALKKYTEKCHYQYKLLVQINEEIWNIQDRIRSAEDVSKEDCRLILDKNDVRCRIKEHINHIFGSPLREQKGYQIVTGLVESYDKEDDVKRFSYENDVTYVVGKRFDGFPSIIFVDVVDRSIHYTNRFNPS